MGTGISSLAQALNRLDSFVSQQRLMDDLSAQLATGKKTQNFAGLENDVLTSKRARANFQSLDVYLNNIKNGDRRIELILNTIGEFQGQAKNLSGTLIGLSKESTHQQGDIIYFDDPLTPNVIENDPVGMTSAQMDVDFRTMQDLATNLFDIMSDIINTRDGDRYLLGGADAFTRPLDTSTSLIDSAYTNLLFEWKQGNITNGELIADITSGDTSANTDAISDTIIGYSGAMSANNVGDLKIRASDNVEVTYTALANEDPFRDLMAGLAFLKSPDLPPIADVYANEDDFRNGIPPIVDGAPGADMNEMKNNFFEVYTAVATMVERAIDDLDAVRFRLEGARVRMHQVKINHEETQNFYASTIGDVEDANLDEVAVKLSILKVQLEASYSTTAATQDLTLLNFL